MKMKGTDTMYTQTGHTGQLRVLDKSSRKHLYLQLLILTGISLVCVQATTDPTSFTCTTHNSTVIQLSWTPATDVSISGYYLYLTRTDGLKTQDGPGITLPARNYVSYTFYGLGNYAQYAISINSYSGGTNYTVITQTCTTSSDNPDLSNFNLTCDGISYTEISCTWGSLDDVYWNGVGFGWQLGHISYYNDEYTYIDFNSTATLAYTITGLQFDTKYLINIRSWNDGGFYGPYTSTNSKTLGWPDKSENETRYYCYEAVPGYLEFGWLEMPCTIYSGSIAGLLLISLLLLMLCCCMCCCKGGTKNGGNTSINIINEENNQYYGDDDDGESDYDESEEEEEDEEEDEEEEEEKEEEEDDEDEDEVSDGDESLKKGTVLNKKKKPSDGEIDEITEDEDEEDDSETDHGRSAEDELKKKEEKRKQNIRERMKKMNAVSGGAVILTTVDETKKDKRVKEIKKKKTESSDDDESEGYYEDWNPDADDNPDVKTNKVSLNDDKTSKDTKTYDKKSKVKNKDKKVNVKEKLNTKNKGQSLREDSNDKSDNDYDSEDEEYDSDDDDDDDDDDDEDEESSSEEKLNTKPSKGTNKKKSSKDSGRGSASSYSEWGDETKGNTPENKTNKSKISSEDEPKKKGGFLSKLFGPSKPAQGIEKITSSKQNNNKTNHNGNKVDYGDWGDDDDVYIDQNRGTVNQTSSTNNMHTGQRLLNAAGNENSTRSGIQIVHSSDQYGNPIVLNAPTIVNRNIYPNNDNYEINRQDDRPPQGYGRNPNGTFYPLPGNYNRNVPPGFVRNPDGSVQRKTNTYEDDNQMGNNPPPGYARNFDGTFYPVRGNTNPVVPIGFTKNPDGTIYKSTQQHHNDMSNNAPTGFGKNPDGTFYPLPGNKNPIVPSGFARNHDGTIRRIPAQGFSNFNNNYFENQHPQGYIKNPDGTFYPKPGNRYPVVPPGYTKNPDGSIYKTNGKTSNTYENKYAPEQPPPGYGKNPNGTFYPLSSTHHPAVPPGFVKSQDGSISKLTNQGNSQYGVLPNNISAPPQGYSQNPDGSFLPLPDNRNPIVPTGFTKNSNGTIRRTSENSPNIYSANNVIPPGYVKNPDGTFRPLPENKNPAVPTGFSKNPDGSIRRTQNNTIHSNNGIPPGYGKHPDGTFYPLKNNPNPILPDGFRKNPDGTISKLPQNRNSLRANGNSSDKHGHQNYPVGLKKYEYGPANLDPPALPDDRDKFNALFAAKAKRKSTQNSSKVMTEGGNATTAANNPFAHPGGDGEDIFAPGGLHNDFNKEPGSSGDANGKLPAGLTSHPQQNMASNNPNYPSGPTTNTDGNNGGHNRGPTGVIRDGQTKQIGPNGNVSPNLNKQNYNPNTNSNDPSVWADQSMAIPKGGNQNNQDFGKNFDNSVHSSIPHSNGNHQPGSYANGNILHPAHNHRNPISFRGNDPTYDKLNHNNSNGSNLPHTNPKLKRHSLRNNEPGHNIGDTSDTEVLPDDRPSNKKKPMIRFRNPNLPAWDSKRSDDPKADKSGKQTPVTEFLPDDRKELIEPEPVLGADRLGNKFPFLNFSNQNNPKSTNDETSKAVSKPGNREEGVLDSKVFRGRELINKKDLPKRDFPPLPNTLTGEAGAIAKSNDLAGQKPETRSQIFYGFGVGRWRLMAATWLNKWKMKKKPVKTARSNWD